MHDRSLSRRAGRHLWIGFEDQTLTPPLRERLSDLQPGGIVLFRRNLRDLAQARALIASLREELGEELVVAVDQEGGLVARFHEGVTMFPGNMALGAAAFREPSLGEHLGEEQGYWSAVELRDLGVTVNLAPVMDLATEGGNPSAGIRSFGEPGELASSLGAALTRGTLRGGVHACLKHFPGLGDATVDSHLDLPAIAGGDRTRHLDPFRAALRARAPLVMTSHVIYRDLDPDLPATLSPRIVQGLLRGELGFDGVVMTDDLEMGAMAKNFGYPRIVPEAILAGHDVLCLCHREDLQRLAHAALMTALRDRSPVGVMLERSEPRLERLKPLRPVAAPDSRRALAVAEAIAGRAITVVRDDHQLLPLKATSKTLLVMPTLRGETGVEDPLRGEEDGSELERALAPTQTERIPTDPDDAAILAVLERARDFDVVLVALTGARFLSGQARLATRLVTEHPRVLVLPIRNPFDLEMLPPHSRYSAVVSFGFRAAQLRALAKVVSGQVQSYGRLPITLKSRLP